MLLLWAIEPEVVAAINGGQGNPLYLPNIPLPSQIQATGDMTEMADCSALLLVTPAQLNAELMWILLLQILLL
jgi:glycerol-3-phosphate dehydrogenase (NAD(P)+)